MNLKQTQEQRALQAQRDDLEDRKNLFGPGRPSGPAGSAPKRKGRPRGASRASLIRKLRRYHPELHKLVLDGTLTPHRAAVVAGLLPRPLRQPAAVVNLFDDAITPLQEEELWLGANSRRGSTFANDAERRRLWEVHRKRLLDRWGVEGRRPQAWWRYDALNIPYPGYACERSTLYEHGLLDKAEARALVAEWHAEFKRAMQPNFFFIAGPGEIYHDAIAREKHFAWADIPSALVQQWEAACQRAG
jgi:hypothetical protein